MPLGWMDVTNVSLNALLLLERAQINWFPHWSFPRNGELRTALESNPAVVWYLRHKCPEISPWLESVLNGPRADVSAREAERAVLATLEDLLVYALDPSIYDAQPFLAWDSRELTCLVDFRGKTVLDIGAGTGRLALVAAGTAKAPLAKTVYAVEPVGNLRDYLRCKAARLGLTNFYVVDGLITRIPFPAGFADVVMSGHVFGDDPEAEAAELLRVTQPGGLVILCPGNNAEDNEPHRFLVEWGFKWSDFEEPRDGMKRKYWKRK